MSDNSVNQINAMSDKAILSLIGSFIKDKRLQQNKTQMELATQAGVARSTITLLENGNGTTLINLIQVLRMLDQLYLFQDFQITTQISPLLLARQENKKRQRARK